MNNKDNFINVKHDNLRKDYQVVKENILNEGKLDPNMTLVEYRLILIALSKISPLSEKLDFIYFTAKDFCDFLEIKNKGMYSHIKKAGKSLQTRIIFVENKEKKSWYAISWLNKIIYENGLIKLKFHEDLEKHILKIKKENGYTKYFIENILKLNSKYSIRIYELLKQIENQKCRTFELNDFKERIGLSPKKYARMNDFRRRILSESIKEINVCTDIWSNIEEIKEGRKTTKLKFYVQQKNIKGTLEAVSKDKIILRIQNLIFEKSGYIFEAKHMNHIHRKLLLELLEYFNKGKYSNIILQKPEKFFINELRLIMEKYDLEKFKEKFKDY